MAIHQLIPSFVPGDATGQSALHLQLLLRRMGHAGGLYADEVGAGLEGLASPASALRPEPGDLVLYHHGIASPLSSRFMHLPCRRGVVFHNISPARFYTGLPLEDALVAGRAQLAAMADFADVAIGVSDFNAAELRVAGFRDVHTVPLFIEPGRFSRANADPKMLQRLSGPGPVLLGVSRVMPHKRFEDLLALHREVVRLRPQARLLMVGGYEPGSRYFRALKREAKGLSGVHFLGRLSHAELVAAYRSASVFVSMSEHEGFGVPLIEAMAAEVPVMAYAAAAVPETLGGAGVAFDQKRFAFLAELAVDLSEDLSLREPVLAGQTRRLEHFSAASAQVALSSALKGLLPPPAPRPRKAPKRPRVGLVVQRYGEVTGGAEKLAAQMAEHLAPHWDITVLTTCAKNHLSWDNTFPPGPDEVNGIRVLRFPTTRMRNIRGFNGLSRQVFDKPNERLREEQWVAEQGPLCPGLLKHLATTRDAYDGYLFFTYLYAPTVWGLPLVADRALLVPTTHDESPIRFGLYADVFERPRALLCLTPEELTIIEKYFPNHARTRVVGVGVDRPAADGARFREKHGIRKHYLLYVGRQEPGKGVGELLEYHQALKERFADAPDLVLAGDSNMDLSGEGVHYLGRIDEQDKHDALAGALAVVVPSRYESLSLLTLEAFAQGTPVLVNGRSDVLVGQVERSGAGRTYTDLDSFIQGLREVGDERAPMGKKGLEYVKKQGWPQVVAAYREEMERILEENRQ
ncbi:glycosyltransferase family 4 protein [Pyxidicoccus fallax]|uniref:Glycosyltransferase family 4 protein n=1 Tax=Pyxidicoccus fallax TaxID=394095 RepID=A0A848L615_9BACT|nr:glycosyltransferase family 4 protein [Pyxidicoccus fallax]NMO13722.1 glycosyltransferase family 4 protein [Pyxidicoccus fallax]NPC80795.1 glycosyltransferase family 4 protein [Pyxidicoccus fallax]